MDFFEVLNARRSVREYINASVSREILEKIIAAGNEAPSGCNAQFRHYLLVDDPVVMDQIRPISRALATAPAAIVVVMEAKSTPYGEFWVQDSSAAMENMLLAAVALGYAGCWVEGALRRHEEELRKILGVPEDLRVWALTPIGKPAVLPDRPKKPLSKDLIHYNRFVV